LRELKWRTGRPGLIGTPRFLFWIANFQIAALADIWARFESKPAPLKTKGAALKIQIPSKAGAPG
jgi:hypothetical protein